MTTHAMTNPGRVYRRAVRRLEQRIHGGNGEHKMSGCGCAIWDRPGFRRPGSMKGHV